MGETEPVTVMLCGAVAGILSGELRGDRQTLDCDVIANEPQDRFDVIAAAADILCFAKLPNGFKVPTPVGDYNPDWVIIKNNEQGDPILYLVRETKGTLAEETLRESERFKIRCAPKHFDALGINYAVCVTADQV